MVVSLTQMDQSHVTKFCYCEKLPEVNHLQGGGVDFSVRF